MAIKDNKKQQRGNPYPSLPMSTSKGAEGFRKADSNQRSGKTTGA